MERCRRRTLRERLGTSKRGEPEAKNPQHGSMVAARRLAPGARGMNTGVSRHA
jgi:hypothetical protein